MAREALPFDMSTKEIAQKYVAKNASTKNL